MDNTFDGFVQPVLLQRPSCQHGAGAVSGMLLAPVHCPHGRWYFFRPILVSLLSKILIPTCALAEGVPPLDSVWEDKAVSRDTLGALLLLGRRCALCMHCDAQCRLRSATPLGITADGGRAVQRSRKPVAAHRACAGGSLRACDSIRWRMAQPFRTS